MASMVRSRSGRIISSSSARVSRTRCRMSPSATGMVASVSADRASLASVHSRRSRATSASEVRVVRVQLFDLDVGRGADVFEDHLVEAESAQGGNALGLAEHRELGR